MRSLILALGCSLLALGSALSPQAAAQAPEARPQAPLPPEDAVDQLRELIESIQPQVGVTVVTLEALLAAFNGHDLEAIMEFFAEDAVLEAPAGPDPWGRRARGKAQIRQALSRHFEELPDARYGDTRYLASDDRGVSEWTLTATRRTGDRVVVRGCDLLQFRDGKIVRMDSFWKIVAP